MRSGVIDSHEAPQYSVQDQEFLGTLFLDTRNRLIANREFFRGTLSHATVKPRPLLKEDLHCGAARLLLFHMCRTVCADLATP